jgi:glutamyl-Q tRNA(Asp) synthetase
MGSLIAALASYLDARNKDGQWLVRMEDLDPPRESPGAAASILHSLQRHGLRWDEEVLYQSSRTAAYAEALRRLDAGEHLFRCDCSRATLGDEGVCRGNCRSRQHKITMAHAVRVTVPRACTIHFHDELQGASDVALGQSLTDFIVQRKDGLTAYQLAVVVDDAQQGITHVVRGSDLLDSTPRQIFLQRLLGYPIPQYCHIPVIVNAQGQKFSKQSHAPPLRDDCSATNLRTALQFLRQGAPPASHIEVEQVLDYAIKQWSVARIPAELFLPATGIGLPG